MRRCLACCCCWPSRRPKNRSGGYRSTADNWRSTTFKKAYVSGSSPTRSSWTREGPEETGGDGRQGHGPGERPQGRHATW